MGGDPLDLTSPVDPYRARMMDGWSFDCLTTEESKQNTRGGSWVMHAQD